MESIRIYLGEKNNNKIKEKLRYLAYNQNKSISQIIKDILEKKLKNVEVK